MVGHPAGAGHRPLGGLPARSTPEGAGLAMALSGPPHGKSWSGPEAGGPPFVPPRGPRRVAPSPLAGSGRSRSCLGSRDLTRPAPSRQGDFSGAISEHRSEFLWWSIGGRGEHPAHIENSASSPSPHVIASGLLNNPRYMISPVAEGNR